MPFQALNMLVFFDCSLFLPLFQLPSLFMADGRLSGRIVPLMRRWMEDVCLGRLREGNVQRKPNEKGRPPFIR